MLLIMLNYVLFKIEKKKENRKTKIKWLKSFY